LLLASSFSYAHHVKYAFIFFLGFFSFLVKQELKPKEHLRKRKIRRQKNKKDEKKKK
jgi:hypothetical protein